MSPFLTIPRAAWVAENELAFAVRDGFPVSEGHTLVIPRREVGTWHQATGPEKVALMELVDQVCEELQGSLGATDFNIGINVGEAAGQTVMHLHVHVIPRFAGDVDDPAGGVRFVIPSEGNYRRRGFIPTATPRLTRGGADHLLDQLRPLIAGADTIDVVAAFVMESGVALLERPLQAALARGARLRLLAGDYMVITQATAIERLMGLKGDLELRVVEVARIESDVFHPKAWRLRGPGFDVAFVGSSNLSRSALTDGVEWNLRSHAAAIEVGQAFEVLWGLGSTVDRPWLEAYRERAARLSRPPPFDVEPPPTGALPTPREVQAEALAAIDAARARGARRALVVLATGMGKTYLAAFDVQRMRAVLGRMPRTLVVAHRQELLVQAARTFRRLFRREHMGWFVGPYENTAGDIVFASIQKLSRPERLLEFKPDAFDYIIVDEVHHAAAASYRALFDYFRPAFWLGLTATPERADARSIHHLFHDEVPFEADIGEGINRGVLVPFDYFGLTDTTDYAQIPWRSSRWEPEELSRAVQTQARMETFWEAWQAHPGSRTLVFCCSIAHAEFVNDWLAAKGVRTLAVHSKSANREGTLEALQRGELDALCAVDLFNEGIDVPRVDRVAMLRPTESSLLFLQQLGRGLRQAPDKARLTVLDFVGNHKSFLERMRTLLNLVGGEARTVSSVLRDGKAALPAGCSVDLQLGAVDLLKALLPSGSRHVVKRMYRELREERGQRPTAGELSRMGLNPKAKGVGEHWLAFVAEEGDLGPIELGVVQSMNAWFAHLQATPMTKCFKMITLLALIEEEALSEGMPVGPLAVRCHELLQERPDLFNDIEGVKALPDPRDPDATAWARYWRGNPLKAWSSSSYFELEGLSFRSLLRVPDSERGALRRLTHELVDWRLADYRKRRRSGAGAAFTCKVNQNKRDPILMLDRGRCPQIPEGFTTVVVDGQPWQFKFMKVACNVARPVAATHNSLPDLLRGWFGPGAGMPGTSFHVRFVPSPDGWSVEPADSTVQASGFDEVVSWPELRAAAGWQEALVDQRVDPERLVLPGPFVEGEFAVRAHGTSMDGGPKPIRDGDWVLLRWARDRGLADIVGHTALLRRGADSQATYHLKKVLSAGGATVLTSTNPRVPDLPATAEDQVLALLRRTLRPEDLAPPRNTSGPLERLFPWVHEDRPPGAHRIGGHLFLLLDRPGQASSPTEVLLPVAIRPSETAFVARRSPEGWTYLGLGRTLNAQRWTVPELDYQGWVALRDEGVRSGLSRPLPAADLEAAKALASTLSGLRVRENLSLRVRGRTPSGGVEVELPTGARRKISLTDIAWVLAARRLGGPVDEPAVNRLRYIEGTPKASTRWIDTGHALTLVLGRPGTPHPESGS